eukprot:snap_masked-scaffold_8-processed-gene-13.36-mRNA-1 protein AED:1.00 eAED:1.00 QI:0/-1/0/0/-1/1/1/0/241
MSIFHKVPSKVELRDTTIAEYDNYFLESGLLSNHENIKAIIVPEQNVIRKLPVSIIAFFLDAYNSALNGMAYILDHDLAQCSISHIILSFLAATFALFLTLVFLVFAVPFTLVNIIFLIVFCMPEDIYKPFLDGFYPIDINSRAQLIRNCLIADNNGIFILKRALEEIKYISSGRDSETYFTARNKSVVYYQWDQIHFDQSFSALGRKISAIRADREIIVLPLKTKKFLLELSGSTKDQSA